MTGAPIIDRTNFTEHRPSPGVRILNEAGIEVGEIVKLENGRALTIRYWAHERGGYAMPAIETKTGWTWTEAIEEHGFRFVAPEAEPEPEPEAPAGQPAAVDGTALRRVWKGEEIVVAVTEAGFVWRGTAYASVSAAARAIVGYSINGRAFFGLPPTRGS